MSPLTPIETPYLRDQAFSRLREAIVSGVLAPSAPIVIDDLAAAFGLSSMPVREAVKRLVAAGLLARRRGGARASAAGRGGRDHARRVAAVSRRRRRPRGGRRGVISDARVVVVGGGAAGASLLYHLTSLGCSDVVLVEAHELTSGSTW